MSALCCNDTRSSCSSHVRLAIKIVPELMNRDMPPLSPFCLFAAQEPPLWGLARPAEHIFLPSTKTIYWSINRSQRNHGCHISPCSWLTSRSPQHCTVIAVSTLHFAKTLHETWVFLFPQQALHSFASILPFPETTHTLYPVILSVIDVKLLPCISHVRLSDLDVYLSDTLWWKLFSRFTRFPSHYQRFPLLGSTYDRINVKISCVLWEWLGEGGKGASKQADTQASK